VGGNEHSWCQSKGVQTLNLFVLSECPVEAAQLQCNIHINKMTVESAQMLSTAHRMLDGHPEKRPSKSGKRLSTHYIHPDSELDNTLYKAVHYHHPCTVWTMQTSSNYEWHYQHFVALATEFTYRYEKQHRSFLALKDILKKPPKNIPIGQQTEWPLAMGSNPECMFKGDAVRSYQAFYQTKQERFKMVWSKRPTPDWFKVKETT
jgi:hypothetical protein